MIDFQCHGCGNDFHVPETMAGTTARCNRCGTIVTIPVPGLSFEPSAPLARHDPYQRAPSSIPAKLGAGTSPGMSPVALVAIGVGGGVAALVLIGLLVGGMFFSS